MTEGKVRRPDALILVIFAAAALIASSNFVAVRYSNRDLAPFFGAGLRFTLAALLFVALAAALRLRIPRGRALLDTVLWGVLSFALTYGFMYWALVRVTAGTGATVLGIVPLTALLLASAQGLETVRVRGLVGAVLAFGGIGVMAFGPGQVSLPLDAVAAMLGAALTIGQSIILGKRVSAQHPAMTNAVGMTAGGLLLLVLSAVAGEPWTAPAGQASLLAVAYLVLVGSMGLFALVLLLVRRWTVSASSYMFVLMPVLTLGLDWSIAREPVTAPALAGGLLVMIGVWFGALSPAARHAAATPAVPAPEAATETV